MLGVTVSLCLFGVNIVLFGGRVEALFRIPQHCLQVGHSQVFKAFNRLDFRKDLREDGSDVVALGGAGRGFFLAVEVFGQGIAGLADLIAGGAGGGIFAGRKCGLSGASSPAGLSGAGGVFMREEWQGRHRSPRGVLSRVRNISASISKSASVGSINGGGDVSQSHG